MHGGRVCAEARSQCWVSSVFGSHLIFEIDSVIEPEAPVSATCWAR